MIIFFKNHTTKFKKIIIFVKDSSSKYPVVHVRVWWIMETLNPVCTKRPVELAWLQIAL